MWRGSTDHCQVAVPIEYRCECLYLLQGHFVVQVLWIAAADVIHGSLCHAGLNGENSFGVRRGLPFMLTTQCKHFRDMSTILGTNLGRLLIVLEIKITTRQTHAALINAYNYKRGVVEILR